MSYPDQGGPDFEIYIAPPPPSTARELVQEQGIEAIRNALPSAERRAFDQANPWRNIERADERLTAAEDELNAFDQDLRQHITVQGYSPQQAQVVYAQTADVRQPLEDSVRQSQQQASRMLNTYQENLIAYIENRQLVQRVAAQTGRYSMPETSTAAAAALEPPGSSRHRNSQHNRHGHGGDRNPLGESSGNRRQGPRR